MLVVCIYSGVAWQEGLLYLCVLSRLILRVYEARVLKTAKYMWTSSKGVKVDRGSSHSLNFGRFRCVSIFTPKNRINGLQQGLSEYIYVHVCVCIQEDEFPSIWHDEITANLDSDQVHIRKHRGSMSLGQNEQLWTSPDSLLVEWKVYSRER